MRFIKVLPALGLWLFAAIQYLWISPQAERLPSDYAEEISLTASAQYRESATEGWTNSKLTARRVDQTLISTATHSIIQGDMHWTNDAGVVEYENTGIYGVDRYTRMNLPDYGNLVRSGPFLFPLHTKRQTYRYWDPMYLGERVATFERTDNIGGLAVYVFLFTALAVDDTDGYGQLPGVPEKYHVYTDGIGHLWIEPNSGTVVDYEDQGVSYFIEAATGKRVADIYKWTSRYSPTSKAFKIKQAVAARRYILALELWLPIGLFLGGLLWLVAALKLKPANDPLVSKEMQSTSAGSAL